MALALEAVSLLEKTAVTKEALEVSTPRCKIMETILKRSYICYFRQHVWESWLMKCGKKQKMTAWPAELRILFGGGGTWWPNPLKMVQVGLARAMVKVMHCFTIFQDVLSYLNFNFQSH